MNQYLAHVAHRDSGAKAAITLAAESANDAARMANEMGFLVSEVIEVTTADPSPSIDACDVVRQVLADGPLRRKISRLITRSVSEGVLVGLLIFFLFFGFVVIVYRTA